MPNTSESYLSLFGLPPELFQEILRSMDDEDIESLACVSKIASSMVINSIHEIIKNDVYDFLLAISQVLKQKNQLSALKALESVVDNFLKDWNQFNTNAVSLTALKHKFLEFKELLINTLVKECKRWVLKKLVNEVCFNQRNHCASFINIAEITSRVNLDSSCAVMNFIEFGEFTRAIKTLLEREPLSSIEKSFVAFYLLNKLTISNRNKIQRFSEIKKIVDENNVSRLVIASGMGDLEAIQEVIAEADKQTIQDALFIAVFMNQYEVICLLLDYGAEINQENDGHETILMVAARHGDESIIRLLLNRGSDVNVNVINEYGYPESPLKNAIRNGHWVIVELLLDSGAKIDNSALDDSETDLMIAVTTGDESIVHLLLDRGADINSASEAGQTSLMLAAKIGNESIVRILLDRGAKVDKISRQSYYQNTALMLASKYGHESIVRLLLDHNANPNHTSRKNGATAIMLAAKHGHESIVRLLQMRGANLNHANHNGATAIMFAADRKKKRVFNALLDLGAEWNKEIPSFNFELHFAVMRGDESTVRILLDQGYDVNEPFYDYETALMLAATKGYESIVHLLLDRGAEVNYQNNKNRATSSRTSEDYFGNTALICAARGGHRNIVCLLLKRGALINHQNYCGETALMLAAKYNYESIVQLLLEQGASIDERDMNGDTAFMHAAVHANKSIVQLLLEQGVNINDTNSSDETALMQAAEMGRESSVRILIDEGADVNYSKNKADIPLFKAVENGHKNIIRLLLEQGTNINLNDKFSERAFMRAFSTGDEEIVGLFLDYGANPNQLCGKNRKTALMVAVKVCDEAMVRFLLDRDADVNYADNSGKTALMIAARRGNESMVRLLLDRGAKIDALNEMGETALMICIAYGHESVVRLLLERGANWYHENSEGNTVFDYSVFYDQDKITSLLLDLGFDIHHPNSHGITALMSVASEEYVDIFYELLIRERSRSDVDELTFSKHFAQPLLELGISYRDVGLFADAESSMREAIRLFERQSDQLGLARAYDTLGVMILDQADCVEERVKGSEYIIKAYKIREECYSSCDHEDRVISFINLGFSRFVQAEYEFAERYYREAQAMAERLEASPELLATIYEGFGGVYFKLERWDEALKAYVMSAVNRKKANSDLLANSYDKIADVYEAQNQAKVIEYRAKAAEERQKYVKQQSAQQNQVMKEQSVIKLGRLLSLISNDEKSAEACYEKALSSSDLCPETRASVIIQLAQTKERLENYQEAYKLYEQGLTEYRILYGVLHPEVAAIREKLARFCLCYGHNLNGMTTYYRGIALCEEQRSLNHVALERIETKVYDLVGHDELVGLLADLYQAVGNNVLSIGLYQDEAIRLWDRHPRLSLKWIADGLHRAHFMEGSGTEAIQHRLMCEKARWYAEHDQSLRAQNCFVRARSFGASHGIAHVESLESMQNHFLLMVNRNSVDSDIQSQLDRCILMYHRLMQQVYDDIKLSHQSHDGQQFGLSLLSRNRATELFIKLKSILDQTFLRFVKEALCLKRDVKKHQYFPLASTRADFEKVMKENLLIRKGVSVEELMMNNPENKMSSLLKVLVNHKIAQTGKNGNVNLKYLNALRDESYLETFREEVDVLCFLYKQKGLTSLPISQLNGLFLAPLAKVLKTFLEKKDIKEGIDKNAFSGQDLFTILYKESSHDLRTVLSFMVFRKEIIRRFDYFISSDIRRYACYQDILREQAFEYHAPENNESELCYQRSWLEKLNAINNENKHVRLTPQALKQTRRGKASGLDHFDTGVWIEYVEPFFYDWIFVPILKEAMREVDALRISKWLKEYLLKEEKNTDFVVAATEASIDAYRMTILERLKAFGSYLKEHNITLSELPNCQIEDIYELNDALSTVMVRRFVRRVFGYLEPDSMIDFEDLLSRSIDGVSRIVHAVFKDLSLVRTQLENKKPVFEIPFLSSQSIQNNELSFRQRLDVLHQQYLDHGFLTISELHEVNQFLKERFKSNNEMNNQARELAFTTWMEDRLTWMKQLSNQYPWFSAHYVEKFLHWVKGLAKDLNNYWTKQLTELKQHVYQKHGMHHLINNKTEFDQEFSNMDEDLAAQWLFAKESLWGLKYRVFKLSEIPDHPVYRMDVENAIGELVIKLRHLLDQGFQRLVISHHEDLRDGGLSKKHKSIQCPYQLREKDENITIANAFEAKEILIRKTKKSLNIDESDPFILEESQADALLTGLIHGIYADGNQEKQWINICGRLSNQIKHERLESEGVRALNGERDLEAWYHFTLCNETNTRYPLLQLFDDGLEASFVLLQQMNTLRRPVKSMPESIKQRLRVSTYASAVEKNKEFEERWGNVFQDDICVYRLDHGTLGDGACGLHALMGELVDGVYQCRGGSASARRNYVERLTLAIESESSNEELLMHVYRLMGLFYGERHEEMPELNIDRSEWVRLFLDEYNEEELGLLTELLPQAVIDRLKEIKYLLLSNGADSTLDVESVAQYWDQIYSVMPKICKILRMPRDAGRFRPYHVCFNHMFSQYLLGLLPTYQEDVLRDRWLTVEELVIAAHLYKKSLRLFYPKTWNKQSEKYDSGFEDEVSIYCDGRHYSRLERGVMKLSTVLSETKMSDQPDVNDIYELKPMDEIRRKVDFFAQSRRKEYLNTDQEQDDNEPGVLPEHRGR